MITRDRILERIHSVPLGVISYSQSQINPYTGRRSDCSGWASYCGDLRTTGAGIYLGAFSTSTLVTQGQIEKIDRDELQPGDMIGYCGPTTAGSGGGHIAMWIGKSGSKERVIDHGSGMGPRNREVTWGLGSGWQATGKIGAWRFVALSGDVAEGTDGDMFTVKGANGRDPEALQRTLMALNGETTWVKGSGCLPAFGPDGGYGDETAKALAKAVAGYPNVTPDGSVYGPAEYVALQVALAKRFGPNTAELVPHTHPLSLSGSLGAAVPLPPAKV